MTLITRTLQKVSVRGFPKKLMNKLQYCLDCVYRFEILYFSALFSLYMGFLLVTWVTWGAENSSTRLKSKCGLVGFDFSCPGSGENFKFNPCAHFFAERPIIKYKLVRETRTYNLAIRILIRFSLNILD